MASFDRMQLQGTNWHDLLTKANIQAILNQHIVWGAACGPANYAVADDLNEFNRVNALLHGKWSIRRSYAQGTETSVPAQPTGVLPCRSMKPDLGQAASGALDTLFEEWVGSAPDDSYLTIQHEMDNPNKNITPASFDAGFNRFAQVAKATNPNVKVGPVTMEYQMRIQGNNYGYCRTINPAYIDFWGFDTYDGYDVAMVGFPASCTRSAIPFFSALDPSKEYLVAEAGPKRIVGVHSNWNGGYNQGDTVDMAHWIYEGLTWGASNNVTMLYYNALADYKLTDAETTTLDAELL